MEKFEVQVREGTGKGYNRKIKQNGIVPAILYGGKEQYKLELIEKVIEKFLLHFDARHHVFKLVIKNGKTLEKDVLIKTIQRDPVDESIEHIDFLEIIEGRKISLKVPLVTVGEAPGVEKGGILEHLMNEVQVECLPKDLVDKIEVDISELDFGKIICIKDIIVPPGIKILADEKMSVVNIVAPSEIVEPKPEEELLEEGAEGEAGAEKDEAGADKEKAGGDKSDEKKEDK